MKRILFAILVIILSCISSAFASEGQGSIDPNEQAIIDWTKVIAI